MTHLLLNVFDGGEPGVVLTLALACSGQNDRKVSGSMAVPRTIEHLEPTLCAFVFHS